MGRRGTDPGERSSAAGEAADRSPHRRPTLEDVALLAGVSRGTVSRVVNDEPYVSAQARARVAQAIRDSGYVTHQAARSLVTWRTNSAAFVVSEPPRQFFEDPNIGTMFLGANGVLAPTRMQLVSVLVTNDEDRAKISRYVRSGHVDGVLLVSFSHDDPLVAEFARAGIPAAMVGRPSQGLAIPYVDVDADPGVRQIVRHLEAAGCRRIGTITAPLDRPPGTERLEAFRRARGRRFRRSLVVPGDFTRRSGELAMERLLELDPGIDGVFAASDLMAAGAIQALAAAGRRVPDDVRVGGFDDSRVALETSPPLTTIHSPLERIGTELAQLLLDEIDGARRVESMLLPTHLVVRESA